MMVTAVGTLRTVTAMNLNMDYHQESATLCGYFDDDLTPRIALTRH